MTKAAVMAWQAGHGLVADGVVGAMTRAALMGAPTGNFPAGCTSASGYSSTTGAKCDTGTSAGLPAGCSTTAGYSPLTGAKCDSSTPSTSGPLTGGAGTLDFTASTANTESTVKEGATEKVLAFKAEADGSDIEVTNVKVVMKNNDWAVSSERLTDYVDSVSVWMGDEKVGEADASDFSKDTGSPDLYTKTIALSNAVIRDGVKATFYVALTAKDSIDTTDMATADWNVEADTVRYTDSTGIVLSEALGDNVTLTNGFEDASVDDDISIKSSSSNPVASTLQVEANQTSDQFLVGAFKLDVDDQSDDVSVTSMTVTLAIDDSANTAASDDAADIIDEVVLKIDGTDYSADLDSETVTDGDGNGLYLVEFDAGELDINAGDAVDVKVYAKFNDQDTNYGVGTTVAASIAGTAIDAETSADDVTVTGSFTGKTHTLTVNAPTFTVVGTPSIALYQAIDGVAAGEEDVFLAKFVFNVTAADDDVYLSKGVEGDANYTDYVSFTRTGAGAIDSQLIEAEDSTLDDGLTSSFLIPAGSTEKFTVSFFVRGNNTAEKFTLDGFSYGSADDTAAAYVYGSDVTSGLSAFTTNSVYLAK
jgi:hypothetical protein